MQVVESLGGILTGDLTEDNLASRVSVDEIGEIVDFVVDDYPEVFGGVVLQQSRIVSSMSVILRCDGCSTLATSSRVMGPFMMAEAL